MRSNSLISPSTSDDVEIKASTYDLGGSSALVSTTALARQAERLGVGDHLLPKITPHVGLWPNGPENPLGDFLASHEKIQRYDVRTSGPQVPAFR